MNTKNENEKSEVALREEAVLAFWQEHDIFNKSLEKEAPNGDFVFYDGPPFATGLPHYGHILAGTIKDAIPRFWTMNGYRVRRKWGWDCHGLPLENLIEKKLGLATKRDIEEYGVKNFNEAARGAVMEYADDWARIVPRMGRWADMEDDYKTMDSTYTESVWWVFKSLFDKGLVYEGFKSMHLCPRCGTTLSNFEVNQGYKDIKDISVYVELPLTDTLLETGEPTTSLIVWTTTPWTLPGNMAAAVHQDHTYSVVEKKDEGVGDVVRFVVATERVEAVFGEDEYTVVKEIKGSDLVGKHYKPPFDYFKDREFTNKENAWQVYHADYVEIGDEGTGLVHIAPAYGDEDMQLAQTNAIPIEHHVNTEGHFMDFVTDFAGQLVKPKDDDDAQVSHLDADIEIIRALKEAGRLFKKENITHSYPHCWRCDTPLLNYATTSWFVRVTDFKDDLVAENSKVTWVPEHVGTNRFGKWLEGARDWAVSRQRYWGAPLPIWRNPETKEVKVFGSLAELQEHVPKSGNDYFLMRHGEAESNAANHSSTKLEAVNPLTEKGRIQVEEALNDLKQQNIDLIVASPYQRTKETAELVRSALGLAEDQLVFDERLGEIQFGELDGIDMAGYHSFLSDGEEWSEQRPAGGESWSDVKRRAGDFMFELDNRLADKRVLIIAHNSPLRMLTMLASGMSLKDTAFDHDADTKRFNNAEVRHLKFVPFPHNDDYELDYHRPYIDDIELYDGEVKLERIPDVFDCWFESGSMPYGQHHYPFENQEAFLKEYYPAQFIAEGLDQTRGWFYSLIVLGTALFGKSPFENVIVNGLVLAEDGKKMSKSLQNYPDPMELANRTGIDAMRFYLLSSPVIRGEDLNFSEKEVLELQRKNIGRLHNVLAMYQMYADDGVESRSDSTQVLDRWILSRLNQLVSESTAGFKNYELDKASRPVTDFIDDLSVWYLRRSRDRLKGEDKADKKAAVATLRHVLKTLALVMAPSMPFYAEYLWREVREEAEPASVHLGNWPLAGVVDETLLEAMEQARVVVTEALQARVKADIKVRQPVASLSGPVLGEELVPVVLDEVNAKAYHPVDGPVTIDTELTKELIEEGMVREFVRGIQDLRKECGFAPGDSINYQYDTTDESDPFMQRNQAVIAKAINAVMSDKAMPTEGAQGAEKVIKIGTFEIPVKIWKS